MVVAGIFMKILLLLSHILNRNRMLAKVLFYRNTR